MEVTLQQFFDVGRCWNMSRITYKKFWELLTTKMKTLNMTQRRRQLMCEVKNFMDEAENEIKIWEKGLTSTQFPHKVSLETTIKNFKYNFTFKYEKEFPPEAKLSQNPEGIEHHKNHLQTTMRNIVLNELRMMTYIEILLNENQKLKSQIFLMPELYCELFA